MNAKEVKLQKFHHSLISHSSKEPKVGKSIKAPRNSNIVTFSSAQKRQHAIVYSTNLIVGHSTANTLQYLINVHTRSYVECWYTLQDYTYLSKEWQMYYTKLFMPNNLWPYCIPGECLLLLPLMQPLHLTDYHVFTSSLLVVVAGALVFQYSIGTHKKIYSTDLWL